MNGITANQARIFRILVNYINTFGYPPAIRDICRITGIRSSSTVHQYLAALQRKGVIARDPGKPRAIRIVRTPDPSEIRQPPPGARRRTRATAAPSQEE